MPSAADSDSGQPATAEDAATTGRTPAEEAAATAQTLADSLSVVLGSMSGKLAELEVYGKLDRESIVDLKTYNKRSRHILTGLGISLAMDISLSIVTILLGLGLAQQNSIQHTNLVSACEATNVTRAQDESAWDILLYAPGIASSPTNSKTNPAVLREQKKLLTELRDSVAAKDAPVNCVKRYGA